MDGIDGFAWIGFSLHGSMVLHGWDFHSLDRWFCMDRMAGVFIDRISGFCMDGVDGFAWMDQWFLHG